MRRFLWADDGVVTYMHDVEDGKFGIEQVQDVAPTLEGNKRQANDAATGWKGEYHHVASLPLAVATDLRNKGILDDWQALKRWLSDSDNRFFRTKEGRL